MDLMKVKTVNQCIDIATVDAHDDDEVAGAWAECLEEVFSEAKAQLAGVDVSIDGLDTLNGSVLVKCRFKKRKIRVTLDSVDFVAPSSPQKIWLKAFLKWQGQGWSHYA
jgi:hypothetical protein